MCNVAWRRICLRASSFSLQLSILLHILLYCIRPAASIDALKVVYAVNAGGYEHTDRNGIRYEEDPLQDVGISSDFGKHLLMIGGVHEHDEILYRTERYHRTSFGYDIPSDGDGAYVLIMKFCEVYFDSPNRKVFDVRLNRKHTVVRQLDIFKKVGRGVAHDEIVYFHITNGLLSYEGDLSEVRNGWIRLDFIKGHLDNPKINAFALLKGDVSKLPRQLAAENIHTSSKTLANNEDEDVDEESSSSSRRQTVRRSNVDHHHHQEQIVRYKDRQAADDTEKLDIAEDEDIDDEEAGFIEYHREESEKEPIEDNKHLLSGPPQPNPYSRDESFILLPVFLVIGAFIPLLFCLCKL